MKDSMSRHSADTAAAKPAGKKTTVATQKAGEHTQGPDVRLHTVLLVLAQLRRQKVNSR